MTAKEKFFQAIEQLGAKRVTEFGWAHAADQNVWVAYRNKDVHIFNQPDGDEFFDHYTVDVEQCRRNSLVLCDIINLTNLDEANCLQEDERILLRTYATGDSLLSWEEAMHAIFLLWDNCDSIVNCISMCGWSRHINYEDDDETDYVAKMRLTTEQRELIKKFEDVAKECNDAGVHFVVEDYVMHAYNASEYHIEYEPLKYASTEDGMVSEAMEGIDFNFYEMGSDGEYIVKS